MTIMATLRMRNAEGINSICTFDQTIDGIVVHQQHYNPRNHEYITDMKFTTSHDKARKVFGELVRDGFQPF